MQRYKRRVTAREENPSDEIRRWSYRRNRVARTDLHRKQRKTKQADNRRDRNFTSARTAHLAKNDPSDPVLRTCKSCLPRLLRHALADFRHFASLPTSVGETQIDITSRRDPNSRVQSGLRIFTAKRIQPVILITLTPTRSDTWYTRVIRVSFTTRTIRRVCIHTRIYL